MRRDRLILHALAAFFCALAASPTAACLPPPPGTPEPPHPDREEMVRIALTGATDVVSGRVVRGEGKDGSLRFRVDHVYKGRLRRGALLDAYSGWGLDAPMCAMIPPPPIPPGTRGTIYFTEEPRLNFLADPDMERAFAMGLLQRPSKR